MAKKIEKIEQISKSFSLENLKKANEKLTNNDDDKKMQVKKKLNRYLLLCQIRSF